MSIEAKKMEIRAVRELKQLQTDLVKKYKADYGTKWYGPEGRRQFEEIAANKIKEIKEKYQLGEKFSFDAHRFVVEGDFEKNVAAYSQAVKAFETRAKQAATLPNPQDQSTTIGLRTARKVKGATGAVAEKKIDYKTLKIDITTIRITHNLITVTAWANGKKLELERPLGSKDVEVTRENKGIHSADTLDPNEVHDLGQNPDGAKFLSARAAGARIVWIRAAFDKVKIFPQTSRISEGVINVEILLEGRQASLTYDSRAHTAVISRDGNPMLLTPEECALLREGLKNSGDELVDQIRDGLNVAVDVNGKGTAGPEQEK